MRNGEILIGIGYFICIVGFAGYIWEYVTGKNEIVEFLKDLKNIKEWF